MKWTSRLLALFFLVPLVELFVLIQVEEFADRLTGGYGLIITLGLILLTGFVGSYLAKREGLSAWRKLQAKLDSGGLPGRELLDGVIILIAGALLITPGVLSDLGGIIGLFPPTRALVRKLVMRRLKKALREGRLQMSFGPFGSAGAPWKTPPEPNGMEGEREDDWAGSGRKVPRHREDPDEHGDKGL